jgi:hypothetical protein
MQLARDHNIDLAISNPSFELWFLLHYQDQHANLHRNQVRRELKNFIPKYNKAECYYPELLKDITGNAIGRAHWLTDRITREGWESHTNPSTEVGRLVESLLELGKI